MNRKKSLSSRLSRREPDEEEFSDAIAEIVQSSDRVAAIMCSAMVEMELMNAIRACLDDGEDVSALFHSGEASPFGTFKQRIVAGKALGLYRADTAKDLDTIRDIRNQFAHALLKLDFENEHIAASCSELRDYVTWKKIPDRDANPLRIKFEDVCMSISFGLMRRSGDAFKKRAWLQLSFLGAHQAALFKDFIPARRKSADKDVIDQMLADKF